MGLKGLIIEDDRVYLTVVKEPGKYAVVVDQDGRQVWGIRRIIHEYTFDGVDESVVECVDYKTGLPIRVEVLDDPRLP